MHEQDEPHSALATLEEPVPYGDLKQLIEQESARTVSRQEPEQRSRRSDAQSESRASRHQYGQD